jgi:hypothetical protein
MICFDEIKVFLQFNYSLPWVKSFEKIKCKKCRSFKRICLFNQVSVKRNYFFLKHLTMILSLLNASKCAEV